MENNSGNNSNPSGTGNPFENPNPSVGVAYTAAYQPTAVPTVYYNAQPVSYQQSQPLLANPNQAYYPAPQYVPHAQPAVQQQPQYYMPQSGSGYYSYPAPNDSSRQPLSPPDPSGMIVDITNREYKLNISHYLHEGWGLFKEHWIAYVLFTALYIGVQFIPYVGSIIGLALVPGYFIASAHAIRSRGEHTSGGWTWNMLFQGIYFFFPMIVCGLLYSLLVAVGLLLLILPGLYFMVVFCFSSMVYIEYKHTGMGIIDSFTVSRKQVGKHFWDVVLLLLASLGLNILGALCFVGILVSVPVTSFMVTFAFRDIFGLIENRRVDKDCYCC